MNLPKKGEIWTDEKVIWVHPEVKVGEIVVFGHVKGIVHFTVKKNGGRGRMAMEHFISYFEPKERNNESM